MIRPYARRRRNSCTVVGQKRVQGLLQQAIIAREDEEGPSIFRGINLLMAAAMGRLLAAKRV